MNIYTTDHGKFGSESETAYLKSSAHTHNKKKCTCSNEANKKKNRKRKKKVHKRKKKEKSVKEPNMDHLVCAFFCALVVFSNGFL